VVASAQGGMFLVGGRTGDSTTAATTYLNDVWFANFSDLRTWTSNYTASGFAGRAGHALVYEPQTALNREVDQLYVIGGQNEEGILKDVWMWNMDIQRHWAQDYTPGQYFKRGSGSTYNFRPGAPQQYYVDGNTTVENIAKIVLPTGDADKWDIIPKPYLTDAKVAMLHEVGIYTVTDMAFANQLTILRLRGFDYPQVSAYCHDCNFCILR